MKKLLLLTITAINLCSAQGLAAVSKYSCLAPASKFGYLKVTLKVETERDAFTRSYGYCVDTLKEKADDKALANIEQVCGRLHCSTKL